MLKKLFNQIVTFKKFPKNQYKMKLKRLARVASKLPESIFFLTIGDLRNDLERFMLEHPRLDELPGEIRGKSSSAKEVLIEYDKSLSEYKDTDSVGIIPIFPFTTIEAAQHYLNLERVDQEYEKQGLN